MFEKILTALKSLDPAKDEHWTSDGAPRIDVIKQMTGEMAITRDNVVAVAPSFNRTNAVASVVAPAADNATGAAPGAPGPTVAAPTANTAPSAPPAAARVVQLPPPVKGDAEAITKAQEALEDAEAAVSEIDKYIESATAERKLRLARRDVALTNRDRLQPIQTSGDAIQAYLMQQRANLETRGKQMAAARTLVNEAGVKLVDVVKAFMPHKAPIDAAMARKNSRGAGRPGAK